MFYGLFKSVQNYVENYRPVRWGAQMFQSYRKYLYELGQLKDRIEAGAPISFESMDVLAEQLYNFMRNPVFREWVKGYMRNTYNVALYDMPTFLPEENKQSWREWFSDVASWFFKKQPPAPQLPPYEG